MLMSGKANRMQLVRGGLFRSSSGAISRLGSAMLLVAAVAGLNAPASAQYLTLHGIAWTTNAPVIQQTFTEVPVVSLSGIIAHDEIGNDGKANGALDTPAGQFTLSSHACSGGGPGFYGQAHGGAGASTYLDYLITSATLPAGAPVSVRVRWAVHASVMAVGQDMSGVNTVANGEADGYARIYINGNIVVNKTGSYSRSHGAYDGIQVIRSGTLNVEDDSDDQTYTVLIGQSLTVSMSGTASSASSIDAGQTDGDVQMAAVWGVTSLDPDASAVLQSNTSEPAPPAANATPAHVVEITPPRPPGLLPASESRRSRSPSPPVPQPPPRFPSPPSAPARLPTSGRSRSPRSHGPRSAAIRSRSPAAEQRTPRPTTQRRPRSAS